MNSFNRTKPFKPSVNKIIRKLYNAAIDFVRLFIRLLHKAASNLKLKDIVLFSSIPDFSDNSAEVFKLMLESDEFKDYRFIWFCAEPEKHRDKESPRVTVKRRIDNPLFRLVNLRLESSARYCVYTHELVGNAYSKNQVRVFTHHASFSIKQGKLEGSFNHRDYCTYKVRTRKTDDPKARVCGMPRNDRLFDDPAATRNKLSIKGFGKVIIWMPTFKHYRFKSRFHMERNDYPVKKDRDITLQEDAAFYDVIGRALEERNTLLIIKYHPSQDMRYVVTKESRHIRVIPDSELACAGVPLYSLLGAADALVTDFSSVCYDYMLLGRPIGFDITDLELYMQGGSTWAEDPLYFMPGEKIASAGDFSRFIESVAGGEDNFREAREKLLDIVHVYRDNRSAQRVIDLMLGRADHTPL